MKKLFLLALTVFIAGCGYSTRSLLPDNYKLIAVVPFENKIDLMNGENRKLYVPGLENKVREAVVDRYLFDGNLHTADADMADLVLKGQLLGFAREELRLQSDESVKEYRLRVTVALTLTDPSDNSLVWQEPSFSGESTYYLSGPLAKSESQAIDDAIKDLAQRIVARTVENW